MSRKVVIQPSNMGDYALVDRDTSDDRLISMWLHGKSDNTKEAYHRDILMFLGRVQKPLQAIMLSDLHAFSDSLLMMKPSTRARVSNAVKSLFSFAQKLGYIRVNPGAMLKPPAVPGDLAARIMTEEQVLLMIAQEEAPRNKAILRLLYEGALRVSELCALTWGQIQPNNTTGGQVTVIGKGDKSRSIPISRIAYEMLLALRDGGPSDEAVFLSRQGAMGLTRSQVYKIVAAAAARAGIPGNVSPHWLRHAHASHALDRGAPVQLVRTTLGHSSIATTDKYAHARPNASSSTYLVTFDRRD